MVHLLLRSSFAGYSSWAMDVDVQAARRAIRRAVERANEWNAEHADMVRACSPCEDALSWSYCRLGDPPRGTSMGRNAQLTVAHTGSQGLHLDKLASKLPRSCYFDGA
ncbi:hypothetical protein BKP42_53920 [Rhodococcus erythropolis]|nr:hypothetical protein BKP42_53920 [Rhodococcus erythropolis]